MSGPRRNKATRKEASHPGRWRSWEVKAVSQLTTKSTEYWSSRLIFPSYFADCCNCFVTHSALLSSKAVDARAPKKVGELLAGIKHPCLHRALGDADDGAHLFDRLLMVVDQIDDLAVRRRQLCHTGAQDFAGGGAIERSFRRVGFIRNFAHVFLIDVLEPALPQRGQRLETGDRQQPGRDLRAALELGRRAPDIEEHLTDQVFRHAGVADDPHDEAVNPHIVSGIKNVHRRSVAVGNAFQQHLVRDGLSSTDALACCRTNGDDVLHDTLPMCRIGRGLPWVKVLMSQRFRTSAPQAQNGFVGGQNCFVGPSATKQLRQKCEYFQGAENMVEKRTDAPSRLFSPGRRQQATPFPRSAKTDIRRRGWCGSQPVLWGQVRSCGG